MKIFFLAAMVLLLPAAARAWAPAGPACKADVDSLCGGHQGDGQWAGCGEQLDWHCIKNHCNKDCKPGDPKCNTCYLSPACWAESGKDYCNLNGPGSTFCTGGSPGSCIGCGPDCIAVTGDPTPHPGGGRCIDKVGDGIHFATCQECVDAANANNKKDQDFTNVCLDKSRSENQIPCSKLIGGDEIRWWEDVVYGDEKLLIPGTHTFQNCVWGRQKWAIPNPTPEPDYKSLPDAGGSTPTVTTPSKHTHDPPPDRHGP